MNYYSILSKVIIFTILILLLLQMKILKWSLQFSLKTELLNLVPIHLKTLEFRQ